MKKILFLIGSANISGGTYVIFQHALYLRNRGLDITIACINFNEYLLLKKDIKYWHSGIKDLHFISIEEVGKNSYDIAIFTWWRTIYYLPVVKASFCIYFVQSIESEFYDPIDIPLIQLVNATYTFGLPVITEATWIKQYLYTKYGTQAFLVHNGIRKDIYIPTENNFYSQLRGGNKLRILVEGPLGVSFKNTERTVEICASVNGIELWLLTSTKIKQYPKVDKVFSCLSINEVAGVYQLCDVLVKLSYVEGMFGPPLEMFHCGGTCIVYDVTGYDEYIQHGYNGLVVRTGNERQVIEFINMLNNDRNYLEELRKGALATAKRWINWEESSQKFYNCLNITDYTVNQYCSKIFSQRIDDCFRQYEKTVKNSALQYKAEKKLENFSKYLLKKYPKLNRLKKIYFKLRNKDTKNNLQI